MPLTQQLSSTETDLAEAARLLRQGGLVAFPSETVYGLGADASNDRAVAGIYAAKGRPSFNPLIVHIASLEAAKRLVIWSDTAQAIADRFWPGPLTMVLPLRPRAPVSKLVTAGLDTLALRWPAHPTAQRLLTLADTGIAGPSANRSGQISPTQADHVLQDLSGRIDAVVDGGPCEVGLESTILGLSDAPRLLRPGSVTQAQIEAVLVTPLTAHQQGDAISAPGQLLSHYAPTALVRMNATTWQKGEARLGFGPVACDENLSAAGDLQEAAANLFAALHRLDAAGVSRIAVSPIPQTGLGVAINDRLARAAAPRDRPDQA